MEIFEKLALTITFAFMCYGKSASDSDSASKNYSGIAGLSRKALYQHGFNIKRGVQLNEVKKIEKMEDFAKKYKIVKLLVDNIFKVLIGARDKVMKSGYIPGEEFPENLEDREYIGNVLENVAFFGDLLLRLPDLTHKLYDTNTDWQVAMHWGIWFSNESKIFQDANYVMLNLVAQELKVIPQGEEYWNPYKDSNSRDVKTSDNKTHRKKEKKEKKGNSKRRGPRLGNRSSDL